jgi:hypothetical protein
MNLDKIRVSLLPGERYLFLKGIQQLDNCFANRRNTQFSPKINNYRFRLFERWLKKEFSNNLVYWDSQKESAVPFQHPETAPLWFCWLQGKESMSPLSKKAYEVLKYRKGQHTLNFIDETNITDFVSLPQNIVKAYKENILSPAHYADVIRFALLEEYGGLWADSTVIFIRKIPTYVFNKPFWTVKDIDTRFRFSTAIVDAQSWNSYFLVSQPHSLFIKAMLDLFTEYIRRYNSISEYFLINFLAKILREEVSCISKADELIPPNNQNCELLESYINGYSNLETMNFNDFIQPNTWLYKLSRYTDFTTQQQVIDKLLSLANETSPISSSHKLPFN